MRSGFRLYFLDLQLSVRLGRLVREVRHQSLSLFVYLSSSCSRGLGIGVGAGFGICLLVGMLDQRTWIGMLVFRLG